MILSSVSSLSHEVASQITCQGPLQHWARESVDPGGWGKGDTIQFLQSVIYCGDWIMEAGGLFYVNFSIGVGICADISLFHYIPYEFSHIPI